MDEIQSITVASALMSDHRFLKGQVAVQNMFELQAGDRAIKCCSDLQAQRTSVTIYNAHDPYLYTANLTGGTMVLAEDKLNEVALGITAAVFGFVLMIPVFLLKIIDCYDSKMKSSKKNPFDEIPFYACQVEEQ
jgi:hypothetical protein